MLVAKRPVIVFRSRQLWAPSCIIRATRLRVGSLGRWRYDDYILYRY